jgi:ATP-dependent RNA helicase DDX46/PRP5
MAIAAAMGGGMAGMGSAAAQSGGGGGRDQHFSDEFFINDYPQRARFHILKQDNLLNVQEQFNVAIIQRGSFLPPNRKADPGEKKLHLFVECATETGLRNAMRELQRSIDEVTLEVGMNEKERYSKYSVLG